MIKFLKKNKIPYHINDEGKLVVTPQLNIDGALINVTIPENFLQDCIVNDDLYLPSIKVAPKNFLQNTIINGSLGIRGLITVSKNFLQNTNIQGFLGLEQLISFNEGFLDNTKIGHNFYLSHLEYLPQDFCPDVQGEIRVYNLKSKTLKNLIWYPGINRELGFNLLKK